MLLNIEDYAIITCLIYCVSKHRLKCNKISDKTKEYYDCLKSKCEYCLWLGEEVDIVYSKLVDGD